MTAGVICLYIHSTVDFINRVIRVRKFIVIENANMYLLTTPGA